MKLSKVQSIDDLRRLARRRLPKLLFELIESGVEDERSLQRNRDAFGAYTYLPRYLGDIAVREQGTELFGRRYSSPFGIGPTGFGGLMWNDGDIALAAAAKAADIPFVLSGASIASIERVRAVAGDNLWAHLYPARDTEITERIVKRYAQSGVSVMEITVDNPVFPKRERDNRNGFVLPIRMPLPILLEALLHPGWLSGYLLSGGMPMVESWQDYAPKGSNPGQVAQFFRSQSPSLQTWQSIEAIRKSWPGKLLLKGIQHPDDAARALDIGADGIIASNHGGKSFDPLPSPLVMLPALRERIGRRAPLMFDSGIRRGSDILIALALGADFTFIARASLYGLAAAGQAGVDKAISILRSEVDMSLAMIGASSTRALDPSFLIKQEVRP